MPVAARATDSEDSKAGNSDGDGILEARHLGRIDRKPTQLAVLEFHALDRRKSLLGIFPLRLHHFRGPVKWQLDTPIAHVSRVQKTFKVFRGCSAGFCVQRRQLRIGAHEIEWAA